MSWVCPGPVELGLIDLIGVDLFLDREHMRADEVWVQPEDVRAKSWVAVNATVGVRPVRCPKGERVRAAGDRDAADITVQTMVGIRAIADVGVDTESRCIFRGFRCAVD